MSDASSKIPDDLVLVELRKRGDAGVIPRLVSIWIYGGETDLRVASERLDESGWFVFDLEDQGDRWCLFAERVQPATDDAISAMSNEIHAALQGTDAEYDGWETSVERSN